MFCTKCGSQQSDMSTFCHKCGNKLASGKKAVKKSSVTSVPAVSTPLVVSSKNKKLGIFFILLPIATLVAVLFIWAVVIYVQQTSGKGTDQADLQNTVVNIIQFVLGLIAFLGVFGIFIFVPLGIVFLNKKTVGTGTAIDPRSGKGNLSELPPEIHGWSWGAAGLTWIWGISNGAWLSLLCFVPVLGYVWWIVLGIKGNEWAWRGTQWSSVEQFQQNQKTWNRWGLILFCLGAGLFILSIISSFTSSSNY